MLDLDHFKHFNDTYGHEAGDLMLREVGTFLQANVRQEDIVCRYGGEEFLIVLQGASLEAADHRAERLLDLSKNLHIQYHGETLGPVTFSMGVACLPDHGTTGGEIIVAADMALFRAKKAGRNRIVVSGEK
jgi:diguanylate cyclase (GGDEF)-like protein